MFLALQDQYQPSWLLIIKHWIADFNNQCYTSNQTQKQIPIALLCHRALTLKGTDVSLLKKEKRNTKAERISRCYMIPRHYGLDASPLLRCLSLILFHPACAHETHLIYYLLYLYAIFPLYHPSLCQPPSCSPVPHTSTKAQGQKTFNTRGGQFLHLLRVCLVGFLWLSGCVYRCY